MKGMPLDGDIDFVWKELREYMLAAENDICGGTKRPVRNKEIWWWNSGTNEAIMKRKKQSF